MTPRSQTPLALRFASHIQVSPSACWLWIGAKNQHGYGVLGRGSRNNGIVKAHRVAYELFNGVTLTPGQCVLHRCDNPACVNPNHLVLGTQQQNLADMRHKGRDTQPPALQGERNPHARLDAAKVREVFRLHVSGKPIRVIAIQFAVSRQSIRNVLNHKTWRHINVTDHLC